MIYWRLILDCSKLSFILSFDFIKLHFLDGGSMLVLSDLPFYKRSSNYILYYILVEGRYSRMRVSHSDVRK